MLKGKKKNIISFIVFFSILLLFFSKITWLFRGNGTEAREDIYGFRNQGQVDVVLYGNSNLLRYYQPLEAWNTYGYTSYNYATSGCTAELLQSCLEETRRVNDAMLYVLDIRAFTFITDTVNESWLRNWSDSIDIFSLKRLKGISEFIFTKKHEDIDILSFYLDILKYHTNYSALASNYQWSYMNSDNIYNIDKGFDPNKIHTPFSEPTHIDDFGELTNLQFSVLNKLLAMIEQICYYTKILPNIFIKISHLRILQRKYPYRIGKIFRFAHL